MRTLTEPNKYVGPRYDVSAEPRWPYARLVAMVLVLAALCAIYAAALAGAQPNDERALAVAVAKVAANEASLQRVRPAEVALIWQVTSAHGETARERLIWLRGHSSCVLGVHPPMSGIRPGNCAWTRNLQDNDAEPEGWAERYPHLSWVRYTGRWAQVRAFARRLVRGEPYERPCRGTPITWGGPMDHEHAAARGLVPMGCRDESGQPTLNDGFMRGPIRD